MSSLRAFPSSIRVFTPAICTSNRPATVRTAVTMATSVSITVPMIHFVSVLTRKA